MCFVVLWLALAYWTFADAGRRGTVRFFWGAVALLVPFLGTLIYLIVRPPEYLLDSRERELEVAVLERELRQQVSLCPRCRSIVEKEFLLCPSVAGISKSPARTAKSRYIWPGILVHTAPRCRAKRTSTGRRVRRWSRH